MWQNAYLSIKTPKDSRAINSSHAEPKMLLSAQCQYPQNRNHMKKSKIAARLKIRTPSFLFILSTLLSHKLNKIKAT